MACVKHNEQSNTSRKVASERARASRCCVRCSSTCMRSFSRDSESNTVTSATRPNNRRYCGCMQSARGKNCGGKKGAKTKRVTLLELTKIVQERRKISDALVQAAVQRALLPPQRDCLALQLALAVFEPREIFGGHEYAGRLPSRFCSSSKVSIERSLVRVKTECCSRFFCVTNVA